MSRLRRLRPSVRSSTRVQCCQSAVQPCEAKLSALRFHSLLCVTPVGATGALDKKLKCALVNWLAISATLSMQQ